MIGFWLAILLRWLGVAREEKVVPLSGWASPTIGKNSGNRMAAQLVEASSQTKQKAVGNQPSAGLHPFLICFLLLPLLSAPVKAHPRLSCLSSFAPRLLVVALPAVVDQSEESQPPVSFALVVKCRHRAAAAAA